MFESRYKNKGLATFIFESISRIAMPPAKYSDCYVSMLADRAEQEPTFGTPGPKSAPRSSKSTTFGKGIRQPFEL